MGYLTAERPPRMAWLHSVAPLPWAIAGRPEALRPALSNGLPFRAGAMVRCNQ